MKTIFNFIIICSFFLLPLLDRVEGGLYAQNPLLYNNDWYLEKVIIDNENYYISDYTEYTGTITFFDIDENVEVFLCAFDSFEASTDFINSSSFEIFNINLNPFFW